MNKKVSIVGLACALALVLTVSAPAQMQKCTEAGSVRSITKAKSGNFETVTFEFNGKSLPQNVKVDNIKPPIENYNGDNLHMKGKAFKEVRLFLVPWTCEIRENFAARTSTIRDIKSTEQFEGYVTYVIGYTAKAKYIGQTASTAGKNATLVVKFKR